MADPILDLGYSVWGAEASQGSPGGCVGSLLFAGWPDYCIGG
jgi:hypothetical protein